MAASKNRVLAVQILPGCVLWAEVEKHGSKLVLRGMGEASLHGDAEGSERDTLRRAVSSIWAKTAHSWLEHPEMLLLFPDSRVTSRYLEIPSTDPERIQNVISFEVSEEIQLSPDEIVWDHLRFSESKTGTRVLWLATRKSSVDDMLEGWPSNCPPPAVITPGLVGSAALAAPFIREKENQAGIVLDARASAATLLVQDPQGVYYARSVVAGTAEEPDSADVSRNLSREIARTYFYARRQFETLSIRRVLVAGSGTEPLPRELVPPRGLQVETLDHTGALQTLGLGLEDASRIPSETAALVAAAIRHLTDRDRVPNFAPHVAVGTVSKSLRRLAGVVSGRFLLVPAILLALCVGTAVGSSIWRRAAIQARQAETTELLKRIRTLQQEQKALREIRKERVNFSDVFMELAEQIPQNITLANVHMDLRTKFTMKGKAQSNRDVETLIKILQEMPCFRDVTVQKTAFEKRSFVFYIEGKIRPGVERGKKG